jgi:hypothetical protein
MAFIIKYRLPERGEQCVCRGSHVLDDVTVAKTVVRGFISKFNRFVFLSVATFLLQLMDKIWSRVHI